jgi:protein TonB
MPPARGGASTGDRYLNSILAAVEQHRMYPRQARALDLGGIAIYAIAINRWGKILSIDLRQSSGASLLDETGAEMIRRSDPLPPVPPDIHGDVIRLTMHLPIYPP